MIIYTIENDTDVQVNEGQSQKTGRDYKIITQKGYMHKPGSKFPEICSIPLKNEKEPYPEGKYTISDDSFYLDRYKKPVMSLILQPVK